MSNDVKCKVTIAIPMFSNGKFVSFSDDFEVDYEQCFVSRGISEETEIKLFISLKSLKTIKYAYESVVDIFENKEIKKSRNFLIKVFEGDYAHCAIVDKITCNNLLSCVFEFGAYGVTHFMKYINVNSFSYGVISENYLNKIAIKGKVNDIRRLINYSKESTINGFNFVKGADNKYLEDKTQLDTSHNFFNFFVGSDFTNDNIMFETDKTNLFDILVAFANTLSNDYFFEEELVGSKINVTLLKNRKKVVDNLKFTISNLKVEWDGSKSIASASTSNKAENYDKNKFFFAFAFNNSTQIRESVLYKNKFVDFDSQTTDFTIQQMTSRCEREANAKYLSDMTLDINVESGYSYGDFFKVGDVFEQDINVIGKNVRISKVISSYGLAIEPNNKITRLIKLSN